MTAHYEFTAASVPARTLREHLSSRDESGWELVSVRPAPPDGAEVLVLHKRLLMGGRRPTVVEPEYETRIGRLRSAR